ncbi:unnamed protein product [Rodentolepis nana]|uniref:Nonsense-mediated mRNA decay factor SMG8 n=1 Tax=Rodentolepis nana TaxID=102285 RepID=A0A0R3SZU6_RODNA|nr:unnamed protein product [Rodentolepis nana]
MEKVLKLIAVSPYCVSLARVACPRLLFVFKLPPTIAARNLAKNHKALANLERNLSLQIFNVFQECALLDGLFTIDGFHTVRVLPPDCFEPINVCTERHSGNDDLAQQMLEQILSCTGISSLTRDFDTKLKRQPPQVVNEYSAPGAPRNRSFAAFLESNISNLIQHIEDNDVKDPYTKYLPELPSVKCWFIICFKLYTSLFGVGNSSDQSNPEMPFLYNEWNKLLSSADPNSITNCKFFASQNQLDHGISKLRCTKAFAVAEAHYLKDLPAHYSLTYHQARVISSYNTFLSLARGPLVVPCLKDLTHRLAHLYLAGRVKCPALLISGSRCRREFHATPQRFPGITSALLYLKPTLTSSDSATLRSAEADKVTDCYLLMKHIKSLLTSSEISSRSHDNILQKCLRDVPSDLKEPWQYAWIEGVAKVIEREKDQIDPELSGIVQDISSLKHLSLMSHSSNNRFISACNCGQTVAVRNDPYDYKEANWDFYHNLGSRCCNKYRSIPLAPIFLMEKGHDLHTPFEFSTIQPAKQESKENQKLSCSARLSQSPEFFNKDLLDVLDDPLSIPITSKPSTPLVAQTSELLDSDYLKVEKSLKKTVEEMPKSSEEAIVPECEISNVKEIQEGIFLESSKSIGELDDQEAERLSKSCTPSTKVVEGEEIKQSDGEELEATVVTSPRRNRPTLDPSKSMLTEQVEEKLVEMKSNDEEKSTEIQEQECIKQDKLVGGCTREKIIFGISGSISSVENTTSIKEVVVDRESFLEGMVMTSSETKVESPSKQLEQLDKSTQQMKIEQKDLVGQMSLQSIVVPETDSGKVYGASKKEENLKQLVANSVDGKTVPSTIHSIYSSMAEKADQLKFLNLEETDVGKDKLDSKEISLQRDVFLPIQKEPSQEKSIKQIESKQSSLNESGSAPVEEEEQEIFSRVHLGTERSSALHKNTSYEPENAEKSKQLSFEKLELGSRIKLLVPTKLKSDCNLTSTEKSDELGESGSTNQAEPSCASKSTDSEIASMAPDSPFSEGESFERSKVGGNNSGKYREKKNENEFRQERENVEQVPTKVEMESNAPESIGARECYVFLDNEGEKTSKQSQMLVWKPEIIEYSQKCVGVHTEKLGKLFEERSDSVDQEKNNPAVDELAIHFDSLTFVDVLGKPSQAKSVDRGSLESPSMLETKVMVDFHDGMPVLGQLSHIMPLYPSWSIHCLGKYSSYSHYRGIVAPGFLRDGNFLLPNDVSFHNFHESSSTVSKPKGRSNRGRDLDSAKLFIGYEMECPLGHRFFLAGINRAMTRNMTSTEVKRAVRELLESDIPIFTPCRCSRIQQEESEESLTWAQLMRIYVAIPTVPIRVRFAPVVQVSEGSPAFHLGPTLDKLKDLRNDLDVIEASSSQPGYVNLEEGNIWVLRLPFTYQHDGVVFHRPQNPSQVKKFRLLKSNIQILHL